MSSVAERARQLVARARPELERLVDQELDRQLAELAAERSPAGTAVGYSQYNSPVS